ncbi:MAG: DUF5723 family protein [Dysgonomonas sp.]
MKLSNIIKYIYSFLPALLLAHPLVSQVTHTDYFMETSYMKNSLNPALRPDQGYLVVPLLPNVAVAAQTNSFNLSNFTFPLNGERVTFMHKDITPERFLSNLSDKNYLTSDVSVRFLALGFYKGNAFWNIDLTVRAHADGNIPKSVFEMIKTGFDQDGTTYYNLSGITATGHSFTELGVSYSRPLTENLTIGVRPKFLIGIADFNLNATKLDIATSPTEWRALSQVSLRGTAPGVIPTYDKDDSFDGFNFGSFRPTGYGTALDLGVVWNLKDVSETLNGLKISGALNDLGFISWSEANALQLVSPEGEVVIRPSDYENTIDGSTSLSDVLDNAYKDIKKAINLKEREQVTKGYSTRLRMNLNIGLEYELLKNKLSFGALYSSYFGEYLTTWEYTVSANYRPCHWIALSGSYSFKYSNFDTFGFAFHIAPSRGLNLFVASDYALPHVSSEWVPTTSKGINAQFGISIPIGSKRSQMLR